MPTHQPTSIASHDLAPQQADKGLTFSTDHAKKSKPHFPGNHDDHDAGGGARPAGYVGLQPVWN